MPLGKEMRVLVIEDDGDTQANLKEILELDGYAVDVAASVRETLQDRDWTLLFAIILDRRLPDGSADSLLPKIRELAPKAAVIVVTGNADLSGALGVIRHGIADFIPKPIDAEMLRASLARAARLREIEERSRQDERLATIGRMMASVAHESRNALQRIQASSELLELTLAEDREGLHDVANIQSAAGDLQALLEEIRGFAAPIHLHREAARLDEIWLSAWGQLPTSPEKAAAELTSNVDANVNEEELMCLVDRQRFHQVFRNLFENSLAACPSPARIRVDTRRVRSGGRWVVQVHVQDNGPGFTNTQFEQLFEPFFTTKPEGTGLGLAIIKRIIEAHGGKIRVDLVLHGDETAPAATNGQPFPPTSEPKADVEEGAGFLIEIPQGDWADAAS